MNIPVELIDAWLITTSERHTFTATEVQDVLLDLRNLLTRPGRDVDGEKEPS